MINTQQEESAQAVLEFGRNLLTELSGKFGGACTLNEVRVMCQINSCSLDGRTCTVTALHKETGIPIPTVSRSVANLQSNGWLSSRPDPDDGRKRVISLGPRSLAGRWVHIDGRDQWITDFRKHSLAP